MRALLLTVVVSVAAACGGGGSTNNTPDLGQCSNLACTCGQGSSCVRVSGFLPFCATDCTDSRDCQSDEQCIALFKGNGFLPKACLKSDRFALCTTELVCDVGTSARCESDVLVTGVSLRQGVCGYASAHCANGCSGGGDAATAAHCN